jgi:CheY-like chemotaxis protein
VTNAAIDANRLQLAECGAKLFVDIPAEPVTLFVDDIRLTQVLSNLLHNATKFTGQGGLITIVGRVSPDRSGEPELRLTVTDNGAGIDPALLPHVFELFMQGDVAAPGGAAGLGVGLALVERIVKLHGGTIHARSRGVGFGSEFHVCIPLLPAPPPEPAVERVFTPAPLDRRVLIVDDNADAAEMIVWLVRSLGGEARTAGDGPTAVRLAREFDPHVVLLDIGLPGLDGYETCRAIRERTTGPQPLIVAVTGFGQDRDKRRAAEAGFDLHLTKPVDPARIEQILTDPAPHRRLAQRT